MKTFDYIFEKLYRTVDCDLCKDLGFNCPFSPDIDEDQDPDGTICKNFVKSNLEKNLKNEFVR